MAGYAWLIIGAVIYYFYLISCIFFTVQIASQKGRRRGWGWLAFFLGIIGLAIVCFLPNAKGIKGETNPIRAAFRKFSGVSPLATWLMVVGLVVVVGGALLGNRIILAYENRKTEKEISSEETEKENVMVPDAVFGAVGSIFAEDGNNFAITEGGDLYGWGAMPMDALDENALLYKKAEAIATSGETTLLLAADGTLYGKGDNTHGLIIGTDKKYADQFLKIESDVCAIDIGQRVAALITERKNLYIWGENTYSQLGRDAEKVTEISNRVASNVEKVVVTDRSVYYLTEKGEVYGIGSNAYGQFAKADLKVRKAPAKIASGCKDIAAGEDFLLILKKDDTLWSVGNDGFGQLGRKTIEEFSEAELEAMKAESEEEKDSEEIEIKKATALGRIDLPQGITAIYAGGHSAFAIADGELYAWGENHLGQLGTGNRKNQAAPKAVYSEVALVDTSGECTLILTQDGALLGAGERREGRLGAMSGNGFKKIAEIEEG